MVDGYSDLDGEVSTTTILPPPQNPQASVNTNSITVSADPVTDADGYRFYRAETSGSVLADYTQVGDEPTPSFEDTGIEDGEKYYYVVTAYTADAESDPSAEVNAVAFLPAPTVTLSENSPNGVLVEWTKEDNSTDGDWRIERRGSGESSWEVIAAPALGDRSYTDTGVAAGGYEYKVVRVTGHDPEAETTASITIGVATETQGFVIGEGTNAVQFGPDMIVSRDLRKTHTGIASGEVEVPEVDELLTSELAHDRADYYVQGTCVFTGYVVDYRGNDRTGRWTVTVDGIGKKLEETRPDYESLGGPLTYNNIALDDALKDYWPRTPFTVSVTEQTPELVAENELVQDADTQTEWEALFSPLSTDPITITETGKLALQQSGFFNDETTSTAGNLGPYDDPDFEDGSGLQGSTGFNEWQASIPYTIPQEHVGFAVRLQSDGGGSDLSVTIDGTEFVSNFSFTASSSPSWSFLTDTFTWEGGDLSGDVTIRFDLNGSDALYIDCLHLYDTRYQYTFDNSVDANQQLSGPELFPDEYVVELPSAGTAYNISASDLSLVIDDTSGQQSISVSNDGGSTYTNASNTSTVTHSYADAGREARVKFTLSRYGSRTTATPTTGFNGQTIDSFEHRVDLNDLTVIDELELSRNHFDNLKKLHNYGSYQYTIEHDDNALADLTVNSYPRGAITRSTPEAFQNPENRSPEVAAETYFNSVFLQGQLREDGTRPTAEVKDEDAIAEDGREISPGVLRDPSISTEAGANFRANALLERALSNNELRGSISTFPVYREPGYAYELDWGNGPVEKTLEDVSIRESAGSISASYDFVVREALAETLNSLRQNAKDVGNQV